MAFSDKTIDMFKEAGESAHVDGAASISFLMKNKGKDVVVMGDMTPAETMCAIAAFATHVSEDTGMPVSKILKTVIKGLKLSPVQKDSEETHAYGER